MMDSLHSLDSRHPLHDAENDEDEFIPRTSSESGFSYEEACERPLFDNFHLASIITEEEYMRKRRNLINSGNIDSCKIASTSDENSESNSSSVVQTVSFHGQSAVSGVLQSESAECRKEMTTEDAANQNEIPTSQSVTSLMVNIHRECVNNDSDLTDESTKDIVHSNGIDNEREGNITLTSESKDDLIHYFHDDVCDRSQSDSANYVSEEKSRVDSLPNHSYDNDCRSPSSLSQNEMPELRVIKSEAAICNVAMVRSMSTVTSKNRTINGRNHSAIDSKFCTNEDTNLNGKDKTDSVADSLDSHSDSDFNLIIDETETVDRASAVSSVSEEINSGVISSEWRESSDEEENHIRVKSDNDVPCGITYNDINSGHETIQPSSPHVQQCLSAVLSGSPTVTIQMGQRFDKFHQSTSQEFDTDQNRSVSPNICNSVSSDMKSELTQPTDDELISLAIAYEAEIGANDSSVCKTNLNSVDDDSVLISYSDGNGEIGDRNNTQFIHLQLISNDSGDINFAEINGRDNEPIVMEEGFAVNNDNSRTEEDLNVLRDSYLQPGFMSKSAILSSKNSDKPIFPCTLCEKTFTSLVGRCAHVRNFHKIRQGVVRCRENDCNFACASISILRDHLSSEHKIPMEREHLKFENIGSFREWKTSYEKTCSCLYVQHTGAKVNKTGMKRTYLYCSRTGVKRCGNLKRRRESAKINDHCTALLVIFESLITKNVNVTHYKTHYGHNLEPQRLRLLECDKSFVEEKLKEGVGPSQIIGTAMTRDDSMRRINFIKPQDIRNIKSKMKTRCDENSENSVASAGEANDDDIHYEEIPANIDDVVPAIKTNQRLDNWVYFLHKNTEDSPIVYFKKANVLSQGDKLYLLDECIIVMTAAQRKLCQKLCPQGIVHVAVLEIPVLTRYAVVVSAVNEFNTTTPFAYIVCTRVDLYAMKVYFSKIVERLGTVVDARAFVTNNVDDIYQAWCEVMNGRPHYVIAGLHVDRDWRENLSLISDEQKQSDVYDFIFKFIGDVKSSRKTRIETIFNALRLNKETCAFGNFLMSNYFEGDKVQRWAACYLAEILKVSQLPDYETVLNKVDKILNKGGRAHSVTKRIQDLFQMNVEMQVERNSLILKWAENNNAAHRLCESVPLKNVFPLVGQRWKIVTDDNFEIVRELRCYYETRCEIKCIMCGVCAHQLVCSCCQFASTKMCFHIHCVGALIQAPNIQTRPHSLFETDTNYSVEEITMPAEKEIHRDDVSRTTTQNEQNLEIVPVNNEEAKNLSETRENVSGIRENLPEIRGNVSEMVSNTNVEETPSSDTDSKDIKSEETSTMDNFNIENDALNNLKANHSKIVSIDDNHAVEFAIYKISCVENPDGFENANTRQDAQSTQKYKQSTDNQAECGNVNEDLRGKNYTIPVATSPMKKTINDSNRSLAKVDKLSIDLERISPQEGGNEAIVPEIVQSDRLESQLDCSINVSKTYGNKRKDLFLSEHPPENVINGYTMAKAQNAVSEKNTETNASKNHVPSKRGRPPKKRTTDSQVVTPKKRTRFDEEVTDACNQRKSDIVQQPSPALKSTSDEHSTNLQASEKATVIEMSQKSLATMESTADQPVSEPTQSLVISKMEISTCPSILSEEENLAKNISGFNFQVESISIETPREVSDLFPPSGIPDDDSCNSLSNEIREKLDEMKTLVGDIKNYGTLVTFLRDLNYLHDEMREISQDFKNCDE